MTARMVYVCVCLCVRPLPVCDHVCYIRSPVAVTVNRPRHVRIAHAQI